MRLLIVILFCVYVYGNEADLSCKDPDTGEYHAVNSTWRSTTFCGNYTCKVRPKNITTTEYIPLTNDPIETLATKTRKAMAVLKSDFYKHGVYGTPKNLESEAKSNKLIADLKEAIRDSKLDDSEKVQDKDLNTVAKAKKPAINLDKVLKKTEYVPKKIEHPEVSREAKARKIIADLKDAIEKPIHEIGNSKICTNCNSVIEDRYLNIEEINSLTKFLYTVKKSDLDTLIEMYNIASEMYGDMNLSATEETPQVVVSPFQISQSALPALQRPYWYPSYGQNYNQYPNTQYSYPYVYNTAYSQKYTPLQIQSNIQQPRQLNSIPHKPTIIKDEMKTEASEMRTSIYPAIIKNSNIIKHLKPHLIPNWNQANINSNTIKTAAAPIQYSTPYINTAIAQPNAVYVQPSYPQNYYNYSYPYGQYNALQYPYVNYNPYQASIPVTSYINPVQTPQNVPVAPCKYYNQIKQTPYPWKTPSLNENTLQAIRANIQPRTPTILKPKLPPLGILSPLNKMRLKRIGKVLRLGDFNRRSKREVDVTEAKRHFIEEIGNIEKEIEGMIEEMKEIAMKKEKMETYISAESCEFENEPGYFKTGNNSLPYPLCCPQRLQDKEEDSP